MTRMLNSHRLGLLAVTMMTLAGCAAGPNQSMPANATKPGCCAGMAAGESCGCCKGTGMCPMSGGGSNMTHATAGGGNDAAKPGCCAGMTSGEGCGGCKGMDAAAVTNPAK